MLNKLHQFRYVQQIEPNNKQEVHDNEKNVANNKEEMTSEQKQKSGHERCARVVELINSTDIQHYENNPPDLEHIAKLISALASVHVSDVILCDLTSSNKIQHLFECMQLALQFTLFSQNVLRERNAKLEERKVELSEDVKGQITKLCKETNCLKTELNETRSSNKILRHKLFDFHTRNTELEAAYRLLCKQQKAQHINNVRDAKMEDILEELTVIADSMHVATCERKPCLPSAERQLEEEEEESKINRHIGVATKDKGNVTDYDDINTTRLKSNKYQCNKQSSWLHSLPHSRYPISNRHSSTGKCEIEAKCQLSDLSRTINSNNEEKIDEAVVTNRKYHPEFREMNESISESKIDGKDVSNKYSNQMELEQEGKNIEENNRNNDIDIIDSTLNLWRSAKVPTLLRRSNKNNEMEVKQELHESSEGHANIQENHLLLDTTNISSAKEQNDTNEVLQLQQEKESSITTTTTMPIPTLPQNTLADKHILEETRHIYAPINAIALPVTHQSTQLLNKNNSVFSANSSDDTDGSESEDGNEVAGTVATIRKLQPVSSAYNNIYKELAANISDSLKTNNIVGNNETSDNDLESQFQL